MLSQKNIGICLIIVSILLIILLGLVKVNIDQQETFLCNTVHKNPDLDINQCPAHNNNTSWLLLVAFGIAFFMLGGGVYVMATQKKKKKLDTSKLNAEEKIIYNLLKEKGSMYQSDLIKETEFSKVKMTRVLDKLAFKNIIDKKRRGMTNIIILK